MDPQALWANFQDTVTRHYFDLDGRVGRAQFWYFALVYFLLAICLSILQSIVWLPLAQIFGLAMLLPNAGMGARRLQDVGRDGKLIWVAVLIWAATLVVDTIAALSFLAVGPFGLIFLPGIGLAHLASLLIGLLLIWFWIQPGDPGTNAYGPPPPVFDPSRTASPPI